MYKRQTTLECVAEAHKQAKKIYDNVVLTANKKAMEQSHSLIKEKKSAIGDPGTGNNVNIIAEQKGETFAEMLENNARESGLDW